MESSCVNSAPLPLPPPVFPTPAVAVSSAHLSQYNFVRAAADVREAATTFGINIVYQCAALSGDNVEFNTRLAEALSIARAKCLPHALSLIAKDVTKALTEIKPLVIQASSVIWAGGTSRRAAELKQLGLDPRKMYVYLNRFVSIVDPAAYRLANFGKVADWHKSGATLPTADDDDDVTGDDGDDEPSRTAAVVKDAYSKKHAPVVLGIVEVLLGGLPKLTAQLSAEHDHVPPDALERLRLLRVHFESAATPQGATLVVNQATAKAGEVLAITYTQAEKNSFVTKLQPQVKEAAAAAVAKFDKHILPQVRRSRGPADSIFEFACLAPLVLELPFHLRVIFPPFFSFHRASASASASASAPCSAQRRPEVPLPLRSP